MARSKSIPNSIRDLRGKETPFKQVYDEHGQPNFRAAVRQQEAAAKEKRSKENSDKVKDVGKDYEDDFIKKLQKQVANIAKETGKEKANEPQKVQDKKMPSINHASKSPHKDEPEIER